MAETNTTLCKWRDIQIEVIEKGQDGQADEFSCSDNLFFEFSLFLFTFAHNRLDVCVCVFLQHKNSAVVFCVIPVRSEVTCSCSYSLFEKGNFAQTDLTQEDTLYYLKIHCTISTYVIYVYVFRHWHSYTCVLCSVTETGQHSAQQGKLGCFPLSAQTARNNVIKQIVK